MELGEQLYLLIQHAGRRFRALDADLGLSPAWVALLTTLRYDGDQRVTALAQSQGVAEPTLTKLVATAEADGLVERVTDVEDGRSTVVVLTAEGRALLRRSRARKLNLIGSHLRKLPAADVEGAQRVAAALDAIWAPG